MLSLLAVAVVLLCSEISLSVSSDLFVVCLYDAFHILSAAIGEFNAVSVNAFS